MKSLEQLLASYEVEKTYLILVMKTTISATLFSLRNCRGGGFGSIESPPIREMAENMVFSLDDFSQTQPRSRTN